MHEVTKTHILGIRVDNVTLDECFHHIIKAITKNDKIFLTTLNPEILLKGSENAEYGRILNKGNLNLPDGIGIKIMSLIGKLLGKEENRISKRATGSDLVMKLIHESINFNYSLYFLGASQDSNEKTVHYAKNKGALVAGNSYGKFDDYEQVTSVNKSHTNIVLVAFGAPKQEEWINENIDNVQANVFIGVGGAFDFVSGNIKRAPRYIQVIGFEWLYRLIKEPQRIERIFNAVVKFPLKYIRSLFVARP